MLPTLLVSPSMAKGGSSRGRGLTTVKVHWTEGGVTMKPKAVRGLTFASRGGYATIEDTDTTRELRFVLTGACHDGGLTYRGKHKVSFELSGLSLASCEGSPMNIRCGKRVAIDLREGSLNELTDNTDSLHGGVLRCKGHIRLGGAGTLVINALGGHGIKAKERVLLGEDLGSLTIVATGDGCKGIRTGGDFVMRGGHVSIETSGNYLAEDTTEMFPPLPFGMEGFEDMEGMEDMDGMGLIDMEGMEDMDGMGLIDFLGSLGGFGGMGMMGLMDGFGGLGDMDMMGSMDGFGDFGGMGMMGFMNGFGDFEGMDSLAMMMPPEGGGPFRPRYKGTTKAVKAMGRIVVEGGELTLSTRTPGAEGLEGKEGVELSGGSVSVQAYDDAINSNGKIQFTGAEVRAISLRNDAVDSNYRGDGGITLLGGHVEAFSGAGPPEEGFDCDEWPIVIEGGEAFTVGSGMGPFPSLPNEETAKQPCLLFQNLTVNEGDTLSLWEKDGEEVLSVTSPVANPVNHSLITSPRLRQGTTYELRLNGEAVREAEPWP